MKSLLLFILLTLFAAAGLAGQSFQIFNERNHPWIDWRVAETPRFKIIYPEHISGIETEAAAIAEASYEALSANLNITFREKIRIYLTDTDEISNGVAIPFGNGYTQIWVHSNDYAASFTGSSKWLRIVIAHELAHLFHFEATRTRIGLWNYLFGNPTPIFWTEGLAQYLTEQWDSQRGDRWLRTAFFDGRPDFEDGQSFYNPPLMYASGHAQLRYFAETRGDSLLNELLAGRDAFAGILPYHDMKRSFGRVTGSSWNEFHEEWNRHMTTYYHTLATQMDRVDSLAATPEPLPGQYFFNVRYSPDRSRIAVLSLASLQRPVRELSIVTNDSLRSTEVVAAGHIRNGLSWHPDGSSIAYSRRGRGDRGALLNDLYLLELSTGVEQRLTHSRRAVYPAFGPGGRELAYISSERGTANIVIRDLETGEERPLTRYTGDVQLIHLAWNLPRNELVYQRFDAAGERHLVIRNPGTGGERILDEGEGEIDNRWPVISPDGGRIAWTSLRDEVPNVFMADLDADSTWRVTHLFTGAEAFDWLEAPEHHKSEKLVVKAAETKRREEIYLTDAGAVRNPDPPEIPDDYASWRTRRPPHVISDRIEPDENLVGERYHYNGFSNLTHLTSIALPYYGGKNEWGIFGFTGWIEPLGRHLISAGGSVSIADPSNSYGYIGYMNRRLHPTLGFNLYRSPLAARFYGSNFLVDQYTGGEVTAFWPVDRLESDYRRSFWDIRLRYAGIEPYTVGSYSHSLRFPDPESARQMDLRLAWTLKQQKPWQRNLVHPLDGYGLRLMGTGSEKWFGGETRFFTGDLHFYTILPGPGLHRFFLSARYTGRFGEALPQHFIGFSRYDNIDIQAPQPMRQFRSIETERVRGYRDFVIGRHLAFFSAEYRMPFLTSLNTTILGFLRLGSATFAIFSDTGYVWSALDRDGRHDLARRSGSGAELKNVLSIGPVRFVHSVGVAQSYQNLFRNEGIDLYYRIKGSVPF